MSEYYSDPLDIGFFSSRKTVKEAKDKYIATIEKNGDPHKMQPMGWKVDLDKDLEILEYKVDRNFTRNQKIFIVFNKTECFGQGTKSFDAVFEKCEDAEKHQKEMDLKNLGNTCFPDYYNIEEVIVDRINN